MEKQREISDGGIYLVTLFESLLVKQIVLGVRSIILHSLNPMYPDTTVGKEDIDSIAEGKNFEMLLEKVMELVRDVYL